MLLKRICAHSRICIKHLGEVTLSASDIPSCSCHAELGTQTTKRLSLHQLVLAVHLTYTGFQLPGRSVKLDHNRGRWCIGQGAEGWVWEAGVKAEGVLGAGV